VLLEDECHALALPYRKYSGPEQRGQKEELRLVIQFRPETRISSPPIIAAAEK
jgi:hypothetical protein